MSTTTTNPLAAMLLEAQAIIAPAANGLTSASVAIERLAQLLCGPTAHLELLNAGALVDLRRSAPALAAV